MDDFLGLLSSMEQHDEIREDYVRAPFSYPGSKARAIGNILPHLPYTNMYVEPFGGTGAVLLARHPSRLEIFNDRSSGVTAFYRAIRDHKPELLARLSCLIHSREEFIWSKNSWPNCEDIVERAARWYYCIRCSFGSQGQHFGRNKTSKGQFAQKIHPDIDLFHEINQRVKNTTVENLDWRTVMDDYDDEDAVWYLDPPYYKSNSQMYEFEMTPAEHYEMLERVQRLAGFVAVSGYPNEMYEKFPWTKIVTWEQNMQAFNVSEGEKPDSIIREVLYIK